MSKGRETEGDRSQDGNRRDDIGDVGFFDRVARFYDFFALEPSTDVLNRALSLEEGVRLLDIAGGTGRISEDLLNRNPDIKPVLVDASRGMLLQSEIDRVQGNASQLPFRDDAFDAAICVDAIHHIRDIESVFTETRRVLKDDGKFVIVDFNPRTFRGKLLASFEHFFRLKSVFYSPDETAELLRGFEMDPEIRSKGFEYVVVGKV